MAGLMSMVPIGQGAQLAVGPGGPTSDSIPAMLQAGSFVAPASAMHAGGLAHMLQHGQHFSGGGMVQPIPLGNAEGGQGARDYQGGQTAGSWGGLSPMTARGTMDLPLMGNSNWAQLGRTALGAINPALGTVATIGHNIQNSWNTGVNALDLKALDLAPPTLSVFGSLFGRNNMGDPEIAGPMAEAKARDPIGWSNAMDMQMNQMGANYSGPIAYGIENTPQVSSNEALGLSGGINDGSYGGGAGGNDFSSGGAGGGVGGDNYAHGGMVRALMGQQMVPAHVSNAEVIFPPGPQAQMAQALMGADGGAIEKGNINLQNRPAVHNADGSVSSVRSMSFGDENGHEILVPTVSDDGRIMSNDEAVQKYYQTGRHLGKFSSPAAADAYAEQLHNDQAAMMDGSYRTPWAQGDPAAQQMYQNRAWGVPMPGTPGGGADIAQMLLRK